MPSGAKRRKAAKKKKEKVTNPTTGESQHEQGNGDSSKSHDEKDSDSGSVSSPTTHQEHHNPLSKDEFYEEEEKSAQPRLGSVEKPDLGGDGEVEVTKEVDFESRVVDIEPWKESNVEIAKEGETSFVDSNGGVEVAEKKIEIDPTKVEEASESKEGVKVEADGGSQSGEGVQAVDVNVDEKIGDLGISDVLVEEREKILPQSNGTSVEINNGGGDPIASQSPPNSNNQPKDIAPVPPVVRSASWKNCCGLLDVFMGSNR